MLGDLTHVSDVGARQTLGLVWKAPCNRARQTIPVLLIAGVRPASVVRTEISRDRITQS